VISGREQIESAVIIVPDVESNSLIISATPRHHVEIMKLIKELDKSPPQVVIQVLIAEVTLSEDKEWAAELGLQDPLLYRRGGPGGTLGSGPGVLFNNADNPIANTYANHPGLGTQMLSNFGGAGALSALGPGGLAIQASSEYLNIRLRALQDKKRLEVLSRPTVTAINNTRAIISVGQSVPRPTGGTTNQYGVIENKIEYIPVNLELRITPTISPEETIVMHVGLQKDTAGNNAVIDQAQLITDISAANNQTVVLGGLITKDETKTRKKVPLLGDVPVLGKMFRHEIDGTIRKELLVILTPSIIQSQEDMERVKQMEYARMSWCQKNVVQVYSELGAYSVVSERPYTGNAPVFTPEPVKMDDLIPLAPQVPTLPTPVLPKRD
jgi:type II secretory pathway component GspD/PulD (secretin)